ncbi:MAG: glycoside hydrolase family 3 protein [Lachnospiraceae bacterium]|nr:glycoside hydrolase family 3 protein [Lachnospiraceae bacterium]
MEKIFDLEKYAAKSREMVAEGCVLLRNEGNVLPLKEGVKVALFGRSQFNYYKSGTGSGGLVNTTYVVGINDALEACDSIEVNQNVKGVYEEWLKNHPFDGGHGWATEPWFQEEMPLTEELVAQAKAESDVAVIIIGRTAGEDQDNKAEAGSYLLTDLEREMLSKVCSSFDKTVVLLNVGNIIDMKWVEEYNPSAVLYVWQGGQEGGNGVLDILTGAVNPSGKLADTIARDISDYPSYGCYGDADRNFYEEDIYVGYRYFETFAKDKVLYPFGFGLSYTEFSIQMDAMNVEDDYVTMKVNVENVGTVPGKEVVQVYAEAPQGLLGKPARVLCSYAKTMLLKPGECQQIILCFAMERLASYDDSGITGYKSAYVLEQGDYDIYVGNDVRRSAYVGSIEVEELKVTQQLEEALAPVLSFERIKPRMDEMGNYVVTREMVPTRTLDPKEKRLNRLPEEILYTGDKGYKLKDVAEEKVTMEQFIAQLSDADLCHMTRGEGMSSPKVTPGTCAAYGGVTERLKEFGIPCACCTDGPSGIRMDCGTHAFSMPNGTAMACSFNDDLVEELYQWEGLELRKNRIESLLGPGMNLHRYPLNGRNFEYFSEDPVLTGKMAAAQLRGMQEYGVTGTIKHFAGNNQEFRRNKADSVISERALREIYLKGFEIAVKEGGADSIMSTYGPVNGLWTASSYDLLTTILRGEWGFTGIVMTDWWATGNDEGEKATHQNTAAMLRSQNDIYMVVADSLNNSGNDNTMEALKKGTLTRGELQRTAINICNYLLTTPAYLRFIGEETELDKQLAECISPEEEAVFNRTDVYVDKEGEIPVSAINPEKGVSSFVQLCLKERGYYRLEMICRVVSDNELAQVPVSVFRDRDLLKTITLSGEESTWKTESISFECSFAYNYTMKFFFGQSGMEIQSIKIIQEKSIEQELLERVKRQDAE